MKISVTFTANPNRELDLCYFFQLNKNLERLKPWVKIEQDVVQLTDVPVISNQSSELPQYTEKVFKSLLSISHQEGKKQTNDDHVNDPEDVFNQDSPAYLFKDSNFGNEATLERCAYLAGKQGFGMEIK